MLQIIVLASLKFRFLILALAMGILALGVIQLPRAVVDALPEFSPPYVEVQTEALGLSAHEVEQLITVPLEADLLNGIQGVKVIRSESVTGMSRIVMVFEPGTSLYVARSRVQEKLTQAHALPQVSKPPTMLQPLSSSSRLLMVSLESDTLTPIERGVMARWTIRPRLMGIPGVANVAIWGLQERQLQVQVDPEQLRAKGVTLEQVVSSTGNAQIVSPLSFLEASTPGTGGFIETAQQRLQVIHVFDKLATAEELAKIPVDGTNGALRLGDVATLVEDHQPMIGDAIVNGKGDGLLLVVEKFPNTDPQAVTAAVEKALAELRPGLSGMSLDASVFRSGSYVEAMAANVRLALLVGLALLGLGVLLWFLSWRSAVAVLGTTVVSLVASALVVQALGHSFNVISIAGLATAAALVAHDAIRVSRPARGAWAGYGAFVESLVMARYTVGYALVIGVVTVLPAAVLGGTPGQFFAPAVVAYVAALGIGAVAALTLAPALQSVLLARREPRADLGDLAESALGGVLARLAARPVALVVLGALAAVSVVGLAVAPKTLLPVLRDRDLVVTLRAAPGTSLPQMNEKVASAAASIRGIDGVESATGSVGRAITGDRTVDVNAADVWVHLSEVASYDATVAAIEKAVGQGAGLSVEVTPYLGERLRDIGGIEQGASVKGNQLDVLSGTEHPLTVRVYGEDPVVMAAKADEVLKLLGTVPGVKDHRILEGDMQDGVEITVNLERARQFGIKPGDVRRAEAILVQGIQVGSVFQGQKVFDVIVQGVPGTRASVESVRNVLIDAPTGHVTLGQVADVEVVKVPTLIARDSVARKIDVVATVDRDLDSVAATVRTTLQGIQFPLEHHAVVVTASTATATDLGRVVGYAVGGALAIFLLLQAALRSWTLGAVAFLSVVAGLSGGVVGALLTGGSTGAWFGLVALVGVGARNALLLRQVADGPDAAGHASRTLASAAGVALLVAPALFMGGLPGLELLQPFAVVIVCGLLTTTAVALALPAFVTRPRVDEPVQDTTLAPVKVG